MGLTFAPRTQSFSVLSRNSRRIIHRGHAVTRLRLRTIAQRPTPDPRAKLPPWLLKRLTRPAHRPALHIADIPVSEIAAGFAGYEQEFPPVLNLTQAAKLSHVAQSTLKRWVRDKKFPGSVKSKKPLLFWRNRFVHELFASE
jgi:predicted DNA-binding transcriptional regulator AlpA